MEAAAAATPTVVTSLDDATQGYVLEEPLDSGTALVDEAAVAATPTANITSLTDDDTTQEYKQEEPLESRTPVDGGEVGVVVMLNEDDVDVHATMASTLPRYVIMQSNHNHTYLRYDGENTHIPNALRFDGEYSFSLDTRFEVVRATTGTGLVHIRSLHINKYWAHFGSPNEWVTAMAVKPEEDQSNRHCTLFRPISQVSNNNRVVRLQHVNTGQFVRRFNHGNQYGGALTLRPKVNPADNTDEFVFIDWEYVVVLPDLIRIKGDNGENLRAWADGFMDYQVKADNSSLFDYEVSPSRDGGIRLKSARFGSYWTDMDDSTWVLLREPSTTVHNTNTVFLPTIIDNSVVLRGLKSNKLCKRFTDQGKVSCLATRETYLDEFCYMEIEEPVYSRTINNVRYHLTDARINTEGASTIVTRGSNNNTNLPIELQLDIRRTVSNTAKWSNSFSFSVGFKMTFQRGVVDVSSNGIEISAEITKETDWEETETETIELGSLSTVTAPPRSRVEMSLIGTRVSYDIPFSYTQRDVLKNGTMKVYQKNDGLLTGTNGYDYKKDILQLPLPLQ